MARPSTAPAWRWPRLKETTRRRTLAGWAATGIIAGSILASVGACHAGNGAADDPLDPGRPGRLVRLADGRRINFRCTGAGAPTVLLESGWAASSTLWYKVQPLAARHQRVCSYDRAGYGFSDPGPMPRDGAAVTRDLSQALDAAGIKGPLVMVGHSAGGLYVRMFADARPRDVVGMVLVDPSVPHQDERFEAVFGGHGDPLAGMKARAAKCLAAAKAGALPSLDPALAACEARASASTAEKAQATAASTYETQLSELDTLFTTTSDEVDAGRATLGDMPLVVLTADGDYASASPRAREALNAVWGSLHRQIASLSLRGSAQLVAGTSHMMMFDRPDAIVQAIEEVSAAASKPGTGNPAGS